MAKKRKTTTVRRERKPTPTQVVALRATLEQLVTRANTGNRAALEELRRFMDAHPEIVEVFGDLGRMAESAWIDLVASDNSLRREALRRQLAKLKADLTGPHATPLEKLLADDIGISFVAKRHAEMGAASAAGGSLAQAAFRLRKVESAQRRFLISINTLAKLRALVPQGLAPLNGLKIFSEERECA